MSATVIDLLAIKEARRAAAAAAAAAPDDLLSSPLAVLIARQIVDQMILDKAAGKMRSAVEYVAMMRNFSILNRRHNR